MGSRTLLTASEILSKTPPDWAGNTASITREFSFTTYRQGVDFALRVAQAAERADHHPDILLGYRRVKVTFSTHDVGGVTALDLAAASTVNGLL